MGKEDWGRDDQRTMQMKTAGGFPVSQPPTSSFREAPLSERRLVKEPALSEEEESMALFVEAPEGEEEDSPPAMGSDPLEGMSELLGTFYPAPPPMEKRPVKAQPRPRHYKVICISLYTDDLDRLDALVETLKAQGHTRASRSQLIRFALSQVDLSNFPRRI